MSDSPRQSFAAHAYGGRATIPVPGRSVARLVDLVCRSAATTCSVACAGGSGHFLAAGTRRRRRARCRSGGASATSSGSTSPASSLPSSARRSGSRSRATPPATSAPSPRRCRPSASSAPGSRCVVLIARSKGRSVRDDFGLTLQLRDWWAPFAGIGLFLRRHRDDLPAREHRERSTSRSSTTSTRRGGAKLAVFAVVAAV